MESSLGLDAIASALGHNAEQLHLTLMSKCANVPVNYIAQPEMIMQSCFIQTIASLIIRKRVGPTKAPLGNIVVVTPHFMSLNVCIQFRMLSFRF